MKELCGVFVIYCIIKMLFSKRTVKQHRYVVRAPKLPIHPTSLPDPNGVPMSKRTKR